MLLVLIDYFKSQNESISEVASLKEKLNNNEIKARVLSSLLEQSSNPQDVLQAHLEPAPQPLEDQEEALHSAGLQVSQEEEKSQQLDTELRNLRARNTMIQKEAKKNQDAVRLLEAESLDSRIADLTSQIREIEEELALFTA